MSESTGGTPAAPTPAPNVSPTPATPQPATPNVTPGTLTVRDAARMLGKRRHEARQADGANPGAADSAAAPAAGKPSPNALVASASPTEAPEAGPPAPAVESKPDALAAALKAPAPDGTPAESSAPAAPDRYTIDGRDYAADDLRKAIAEYGDYTKKTQALAAEQKRVNDQAQQLRQLHEQHQAFATVLPLLQPELNRLAQSFQMAPRPDPALAESDPHGYLKQLAAHDASRSELERLQQIMGVQTGAQSRQLAEATERGNQYLSERYPVWRDPAQRAELQRTIVEWAESKGGFTRDELKSVVDPRHIEALMKAAMYDRLSEGAKTRAPVQMAPANGSAPAPPPREAIRVAEANFGAKPSWRTGAALLSARRSQGR